MPEVRALAGHGFLSAEAAEDERRITADYADVFDAFNKHAELFFFILQHVNLDLESAKSIVIESLAVKTLELFQSVEILLRKGCIPAAKSICRVQIETVYKLRAIVIETDALEKYADEENSTRVQKLKAFRKHKQRHEEGKIDAGIKSEIARLSTFNRKNIRPCQWAKQGRMKDFHDVYYQGLSDDIHASIESLDHYFKQNSDGAYTVYFGPSIRDLRFIAAASQRTLLSAMEKYADFRGIDVDEKLSKLNDAVNAVESRTDA